MVHPDADAYFDLEGNDVVEVLLVILEDIQQPFIIKLVESKGADSLCGRLLAPVGELRTPFDIDENGMLVQLRIMEDSLWKLVASKLRRECFYNADNPVAKEHPGSTRMFYTMERAYFCPHRSRDVSQWMETCVSCRQSIPTNKLQRRLQRFLISGALKLVVTEILGTLLKTLTERRVSVSVTYCHFRTTRAIPMITTTVPQISMILTNN